MTTWCDCEQKNVDVTMCNGCQDDDLEAIDCDHDDYETDILTGRATCNRCGERWWLTSEDMEREQRRDAECAKWCAKQERREFWRRLTYPIRWPVHRLLDRIWPRKSISVLTDDEIPF